MGEVIGRCRKCGKLMGAPHPSGICARCRRFTDGDPILPVPLRHRKGSRDR